MNTITEATPMQSSIWQQCRAVMGLTVFAVFGLGLLYSLSLASVGQLIWPSQAQGSLLKNAQGQWVGSSLIAQPFQKAQYFWPRPSAADYQPMAMSGSNLAQSNPALQKRVAQRLQYMSQMNQVAVAQIPSDLVTSSGSAMDPDISVAAAQLQVARVAKARQLDVKRVQKVLAAQIQAPQFGIFGQARVNVLRLNLALDQLNSAANL